MGKITLGEWNGRQSFQQMSVSEGETGIQEGLGRRGKPLSPPLVVIINQH